MKTETTAINIDSGKGDFSYPEAHVRDAGTGLSERTIHYIADVKEDPDWVRDFRLRALKTFLEKPLPTHWASKELEATDYYAKLYEKMELLGMDRSFTSRAVNEGFSGGEKKRAEILQLAMLEPKYAVLDETDSGLDIDALKTVAHGVNSLRGPDLGILLITHYQRLLNYIVPDYVHVMVGGRIVRSGRKELALELEERGYDWTREGAGEPAFTR